MATNPYDGGAGTVALDTRLPHDFERVNATGDAFGAAVARGTHEAGEGAVKASEFYGQVVADDAANTLFDRWNKRMYGDSSKMVPQPDGTMVPDTGYMGLKGRSAADARPGLEKAMDDDLKEIRKNLTSPRQQLQFDQDSRRYRIQLQQHVGAHAEGQFGVWANEVNKSAVQTSLTTISNNAYDDEVFKNAAADTVHFYWKDAQLAGGGKELIDAGIRRGTQEAWRARLETISVHNPAQAAKMADEHQEELGHLYEPLANQFRARASQAVGIGAANDAIYKARTGAIPIPPPGRPGPVSGDDLHRAIIMQESHGNRNAPASSDDARGIGQIIPETFARYAKPGEKIDNPDDNFAVSRRIVDDLARKFNNDPARVAVGYFSGEGNVAPAGSPAPWKKDLADSSGKLTSSYVADIQKRLGQPVTGQAATSSQGGAVQLASAGPSPQNTGIVNPSQPPVEAALPTLSVPPPPATLEQLKASAYLAIRDNPKLSHDESEHAYREISRQIAEEQVIEQAGKRAKDEANEKAANGYFTRILNGNAGPGVITQIGNDPALKWETKHHLVEAVKHYSGSDVEASKIAYGPGFWDAYKAVTAEPGDPSRIADVGELLRRAGPGGDLTLPGVTKLHQTMMQSQKSVSDSAVNTTKTGLLNYAKQKLSFDQEFLFPGVPPLKDPVGMQIFQGHFIPKFEAAYDEWVKDGKDPWQFLTYKNVDSMLEGMRPKSEMAMDKVAAKNAVVPSAQANVTPAAPAGFSPQAWEKVVSARPVLPDGSQVSRAAWGEAVSMLLANPTEKTIEAFNKSALGKSGLNGKKVLEGIKEMNEKAKDQDERWLPSWLGFPYSSEE
jgi:hypothetical protein